MRTIDARRIFRRVQSLLSAIGEKSDSLKFVISASVPGNSRYALFEASGEYERLIVYVDEMPLGANDFSFEEIAVHEVRHIIQFRRGAHNFSRYAALYRRVCRIDREMCDAHGLFRRVCNNEPNDALEADALFVTALICEYEIPITTALTL